MGRGRIGKNVDTSSFNLLGRGLTGDRMKSSLTSLSRILTLVLLAILIAILNPNFLKTTNLVNILRQASPQIIAAIGMTIVLLTGGIDLSVGSTMTLASVVSGYFLTQVASLPWQWAALAGLATGAAIGLLNGLMIAKIRLPAPIATYGMLWFARGLSFALMGTNPFYGFADGFRKFGRGYWLGIPIPIWVMVGVAVVMVFILRKTIFGRRVYAVGSNGDAAKASGIRSDRILILVYVLSGLLAALAGLLLTARLNAVDQDIGEPYLLPALASPIMGGTSMAGGEGTIGGSIIGSLIMVVILNGMNLLNISSLWQQLVIGIVMLFSVWIDVIMRRKDLS
jgi:ribose transport system permease protein